MRTVLLQASVSNDQLGGYLIYGLVYVIGMVIFLYVAAAIFKIPRLIKYHQIQCRLLSRIAKAHGATDEEIDEMYR